jgi:hypothetical protein
MTSETLRSDAIDLLVIGEFRYWGPKRVGHNNMATNKSAKQSHAMSLEFR